MSRICINCSHFKPFNGICKKHNIPRENHHTCSDFVNVNGSVTLSSTTSSFCPVTPIVMCSNKKYRLTTETHFVGVTPLYRIEALKDFGNIKKGQLGGFVQKESNLSHEGACWIHDDAMAFENCEIEDNAQIYENVRAYGRCRLFGDCKAYGSSVIAGYALVSGFSELWGDVYVGDSSIVHEWAKLTGNVKLADHAEVRGDVFIKDDVCMYGFSLASGEAHLKDRVMLGDHAKAYGQVCISDDAVLLGYSEAYGQAVVSGYAILKDRVHVCGTAKVTTALSGNIRVVK